MKRLFLRFVLLSTLLVLCCVVISLLLLFFPPVGGFIKVSRPGGWGHTLVRMKEAQKLNEDVDVLFVGSSHVYRGVDPRIVEPELGNIFNLGTSSQSPMCSYYLLKDYLEKIEPETIILDVYWNAVQESATSEATMDIVRNNPITANMLLLALKNYDLHVYRNVIINYTQRLFRPYSELRQEPIKYDKYVDDGFVETNRTWNKNYLTTLQKNSAKKIGEKVTLDNDEVRYLDAIVAMCKKKNVNIIFVTSPVTKMYLETILNYPVVSDKIQDLASDRGVKYYDFNQMNLNLNDEKDFYDQSHLDQSGVVKYNKVLKSFLKSEISRQRNG